MFPTNPDQKAYQLLVKTNPDFARKFFVRFYSSCEKYKEQQMKMTIHLAATAYKNYLDECSKANFPHGYDEDTWV